MKQNGKTRVRRIYVAESHACFRELISAFLVGEKETTAPENFGFVVVKAATYQWLSDLNRYSVKINGRNHYGTEINGDIYVLISKGK